MKLIKKPLLLRVRIPEEKGKFYSRWGHEDAHENVLAGHIGHA